MADRPMCIGWGDEEGAECAPDRCLAARCGIGVCAGHGDSVLLLDYVLAGSPDAD